MNFIDTYHRTGLYKLPLPAIIGSEAAGVVEKTGEGVNGFKPGDQVAHAMARGSMPSIKPFRRGCWFMSPMESRCAMPRRQCFRA